MPYSGYAINLLLGQILIIAERLKNQTSDTANLSQKIEEMCRYIDEHIIDTIKVSDLSSVFSYHPVYINSLFRRFFNKSAHSYILERQIENAVHMLTFTDYSVADIAQLSGFCDSSHMGKVFKKHLGVSPKEIRNHTDT